MGVRGFDLLELAVTRNFPVVMLTAHALTPESLRRSYEMGARAYLPKEKLGEIVPFLEDVLKYDYLTGWKRLVAKLEGFFNERWGQHWRKTEGKFWEEFDQKTAQIKK
jgi:DNA-binding NarL/FixJ family response regulator